MHHKRIVNVIWKKKKEVYLHASQEHCECWSKTQASLHVSFYSDQLSQDSELMICTPVMLNNKRFCNQKSNIIQKLLPEFLKHKSSITETTIIQVYFKSIYYKSTTRQNIALILTMIHQMILTSAMQTPFLGFWRENGWWIRQWWRRSRETSWGVSSCWWASWKCTVHRRYTSHDIFREFIRVY